MATSAVTASAASLTLTLNGRDLTFKPWTQGDYADIMAFCQDRHIETVKRNLTGLQDAERMALLQKAVEEAQAFKFGGAAVERFMTQPYGIWFMIWLSLRHAHPSIGLQEVSEVFQKDADAAVAMDKINWLNNAGSRAAKKKRAAPARKKATKRKAKRKSR